MRKNNFNKKKSSWGSKIQRLAEIRKKTHTPAELELHKNHNEIDYKLSFAFNLIKEKTVPHVQTDVENYTLMICAPEFSL